MIRNYIFSIFFFSGIIFISLIFLPAFFLPQKITLFGGKIMGHWTGLCLKFFLSTKINIKGIENIIKNEKFFIASSHQSMFETFYLQTIFNSPVFILKKELLQIPIFGWYLKKIGSISIKRNKVLPDERTQFKKGVSRIYEELKITCQPVAINSGYVWPKIGSKNSHKIITISILKPIEAGLSKEEFIKNLENNIYSELNRLN